MKAIFVGGLLFLGMLGCGVAQAEATSDAEKAAVGTWYGEFSPSAGQAVQRFLTIREADGSLTIQARLYEGSKVLSEVRNRGLWGISNGMYFTVTTEVNGQKTDPRLPEVINAYLIQKLAAGEFEYLHVASGNRFHVQKVDPAKAQLP